MVYNDQLPMYDRVNTMGLLPRYFMLKLLYYLDIAITDKV